MPDRSKAPSYGSLGGGGGGGGGGSSSDAVRLTMHSSPGAVQHTTNPALSFIILGIHDLFSL